MIAVASPLDVCKTDAAACGEVFKGLTNPYSIGDHPALTQTTGWVDAASAEDLAAARDTALDPAVLDAFALAIIAGDSPAQM